MKLYTYADPFHITDEAYWGEIGSCPHFCVSQTLVQGLRTHYGRDRFTHLCTIDKIINGIYGDWYVNPEINIAQFVSFSRRIDAMPEGPLKRSFKFNQRSLVEAARFLLTIGADSGTFKYGLSNEQRAFLEMLDAVKTCDYWQYSKDRNETAEGLKKALADTLADEIREFTAAVKQKIGIQTDPSADLSNDIYLCLQKLNSKADEDPLRSRKRLEHYLALLSDPATDVVKKVVLHGVHQFTPKILSCVRALERAGIEVVFLFNYQAQYRHMYETWEKVYAFAGADFSDSGENGDFDGRLLGACIGNVLEGRRSGDVRPESSIMRFQNRTEFTDLAAAVYGAAEKKTKPGSDVLSMMEEQFYGVRGDEINEILKFYFPNQFGGRHFLAYPIGQFILSLYNMWHEGEGLLIEEASLKECLSINIWGLRGTSTPIGIYEKLKAYISDLSGLDEIIERLGKLTADAKQLEADSDNPLWKQFSFFYCDSADIRYFVGILKDLREIADELFYKESGKRINFRKHFERLIQIIAMRMKNNRFIGEQERQLVAEVQDRLSSLKGNRSIEGSIEDLRETLHYYLKGGGGDESANWIVRNLDQIDGGVLLSPYSKAKVYHYGLLSDQNMKKLNDEFFPWPLTARMFEAVGSENPDVPIILTSYREYRNYLRYCIFYGTYYLDVKKQIQFSYIDDNGSEKGLPYYILTLLGLKIVPSRSEYRAEHRDPPVDQSRPDIAEIAKQIDAATKEERETYCSCKYRFLLSHALDGSVYFPEAFDCKRLYSLLLFSETWKSNVGTCESDIRMKLKETARRLRPYFPFFKAVDFFDLENAAYDYFTAKGMIQNGVLQIYHPNYVRRKTEFKDQTKARRHRWNSKEVFAYLCSDKTKEPQQPPENDSVLCRSCSQRSICMRSYMQEDSKII